MKQDRERAAVAAGPPSGKDEMNLAEFPIALLSERAPRGQKTIEFEDRFYDDRTGKVITRRVTITGSDKYGLPMAKDDEVILGLIQLTKLANGFTNRTVHFSRSDLIRLLDWPDTGKSYRRLARSFDCWTFAGLSYENAWWDHEHRSWVSEKFHILDRVTIYGEGRGPRREAPRLSSFTWSEVIFHSFQSGYLKRFDFDFYRGLETSTAKRMYRFLDKRFYLKRQWEFDLKDFALTHVGLSRSYEGGTQIARKLRPAIEELEAKGFLEPLGPDERFVKGVPGAWQIVLVGQGARGIAPQKPGPSEAGRDEVIDGRPRRGIAPRKPEPSELEVALIERGVTPATAAELRDAFPAEQIRTRIEAFDWLVEKKDRRVSKSPGGYLAESIRKGYAAPKGFEPKAERAKRLQAEVEQERRAEAARRSAESEGQAREEAQQARIASYWASLTPADQEALKTRALAGPSPFLSLYRQHQGRGTPEERLYLKLILEAHIVALLGDPGTELGRG